jgi:tetratricopeptide (TPR) repeat protein
MRFVWAGAILLTAGCWTALAESAGIKPETCLSVRTAALRLGELAETIRSCTGVINDKSLTEAIRLEATAQRGILYARRWRLTDVLQDAREAIGDFSEVLRVNTIAREKRHQLLTWRGELYGSTGEARRARDDFTAVLRISPSDEIARAALRRLDAPTN